LGNDEKIDVADCVELTKQFMMEEVEVAIKSMRANTAVGPDGFPVQFYKGF
jgi:hypothetical protein